MLAALSVIVLVATLFGLTATGPATAVYGIHLAVMGLGFVLFGRTFLHHMWAWRRPDVTHARTEIPRALKLLTIVAFVACIVSFMLSFNTYGEGGPEFQAGHYTWVRDGIAVRELTYDEYRAFEVGILRVFATAWLAFSLMIAWAEHVVDTHLRRLRGTPASVAA